MNIFDVIILSIIEGVTEFLPISSTGHLILTSKLLALPATEFLTSFEIFIQLGAILAVVVLYWKSLLFNKQILLRVFLAFLPAAIIGLSLFQIIKQYFLTSSTITLWALGLGGIAIIIFELFYKQRPTATNKLSSISLLQAILIGIFQSLAIIPGVSRAAATIIGGLALGLKRSIAVEFSFLLAVPTMLAATGLDLIKTGMIFSKQEIFLLLTGFSISFIIAYIVIRWFIRFIQTHTFTPFGIYRIILALIAWLILI